MRVALYARVSTEEQLEGYSIDAQQRNYHTLLEGRGWASYTEYIEEGKSARSENINKRPKFKEMIADALAHRFDVLVVDKLDRFSRRLPITLEYFNRLREAGVGFVSIREQFDFSTPVGKVILSVLGALAEWYSDNLSEETKKGWGERKEQGLYCGLLPFGAMKGEDGVPVPDTREVDSGTGIVRNYDGLLLAFELAAQGTSAREVAQALNSRGYRTAGNQGNRPFTKDTVRGMLPNRFYLGELPDGNGKWRKGKHQPFISEELFNAVQEARMSCRSGRSTVRRSSTTYSLSSLLWCHACRSKIRIQPGYKGRPRVFCAGRSQGLECKFQSTFLDVCEAQIEWYLENFVIPEDYQQRILDAHRKLQSAYDDTEKQRARLNARLERIGERYDWGHMPKEKYLTQYEEIQKQLRALAPPEDKVKNLDRLAHFLSNVAEAWKEATQEQRNKLAKALFEEIWLENNRVVGVKPRPELEPFFRLSYEEFVHTSDPEGIRGRMFQKLLPGSTQFCPQATSRFLGSNIWASASTPCVS